MLTVIQLWCFLEATVIDAVVGANMSIDNIFFDAVGVQYNCY